MYFFKEKHTSNKAIDCSVNENVTRGLQKPNSLCPQDHPEFINSMLVATLQNINYHE